MNTVFLRLLEADDKAAALLSAIREAGGDGASFRFQLDPQLFSDIPRAPFAYWAGASLRRLFVTHAPFEAAGRNVKQGLATADDFRFVRSWWAVAAVGLNSKWRLLAKGGAYSPFFADVYLVVKWENAGRDIKGFSKSFVRNEDCFCRPGLTWPLRTQRGLSLRALPGGCVFGHKGPAAFVDAKNYSELLAMLGVTNSSTFRALVNMQMAFGSYEVGVLQRTPIPTLTASSIAELSGLALRAWSLKRTVDSVLESSHAFTIPALLQATDFELEACAAAWSSRIRSTNSKLVKTCAELDEQCFQLYGIPEGDWPVIAESFDTATGTSEVADENEGSGSEGQANEGGFALSADLSSWAIGVAFGRFDLRLATGGRAMPPEPEPFDPLPVCSPGMLTGEDGLPLAKAPADYPISFPEDGVLVDDPGHRRDLLVAVRAVFDVVFGDASEQWWNDVAALLDPKSHDLRKWLSGSFFEFHLKRYSKSRRKAPILWQLATASSSYSVWLYAHRISRDTFFQLQNDIIGPKVEHETRQLASLTEAAGTQASARERKEIAAQEALVDELRALHEEVKRVAPLWNPNLDDGIVLVLAPLWRLVPQHKAWQKELKSKWDELCDGKYDWAHLAMHLWPERVVPKCAEDRSLAIAHGLEDEFWFEDSPGKWQPREEPTIPIAELVAERSSAAVKAALDSLLQAPGAGKAGTAKSSRKPR